VAGVLTAAVGVDEAPQRGLVQRQCLFQGCEHQFGRHLRGQVLAYHASRAGIASGSQVAPAPADQQQVRDVANPHLIGALGAGWPSSRFSATVAAGSAWVVRERWG